MMNVTPLLYQSGYLTIKDYIPFAQLYTLDIPNQEVRLGLMNNLMQNYVPDTEPVGTLLGLMAEQLHTENMDGALHLLQTEIVDNW